MSNEPAVREMRRNSVWRVFLMLLGLLCWVLTALWYFLPPSQAFVEQYFSRAAYRVIGAVVAPITNSIPFSLALVLVVALIIGYPALWAINWVHLRRRYQRAHFVGLFWGFKWAFFVAPILFVWFLGFWGAGYQRESAEKRLGMNATAITDEQAGFLRAQILEIILRDAPKRPEDRDTDRALAAVALAMRDTIREWDGRSAWVPLGVKATPPGLLLANGTSGVCTPYTLEPHVDGALPDTAFVATGAHELGHIAGMCAEDEATLIGFVAGLRADDAYARYAVAVDIYVDLARELTGDARKAAFDALPEVAREDLKKAREASERYRIQWFQKASWRAYNTYLQSQGIAEGVKNYARGISLFVYLWRDGRVDFAGLNPPPASVHVEEVPGGPAPPLAPANTPSLAPAPDA